MNQPNRCLALLKILALASVLAGVSSCTERPHAEPVFVSLGERSLTVGSQQMPNTHINAVSVGRITAVKYFVSRQWRIVAIDDESVSDKVVVDLSRFSDGVGRLFNGCESVDVHFRSTDIVHNRLTVLDSRRDDTACDSPVIERIMWLLGDVYGYERIGKNLAIIAPDHRILLEPIS